jgi:hypothetical protein
MLDVRTELLVVEVPAQTIEDIIRVGFEADVGMLSERGVAGAYIVFIGREGPEAQFVQVRFCKEACR